MSFHQQRPEERWRIKVVDIAMCFVMAALCYQVVSLRAENAALTKQLDYHTCRVQLDPMPVPEQVGESPTLADHPSIEDEIADATRMPAGVVGSPVQDLRAEYASKYHRAHLIKVAEVGHCEGCGVPKVVLEADGHHLETHHEISVKRIFDEGLDHSLIYDPANFCVFCRTCHHDFGHPNGWGNSNPNVRRDAARNLKMMSKSKTTVTP